MTSHVEPIRHTHALCSECGHREAMTSLNARRSTKSRRAKRGGAVSTESPRPLRALLADVLRAILGACGGDSMKRHIVIRMNQSGIGSVKVNGIELNHMIRSTCVFTKAGTPTRVEVEFIPEMVTVDAEGFLRLLTVEGGCADAPQADGFKRHKEPKKPRTRE